MNSYQENIDWLMEGDPSVKYLTQKYLLNNRLPDIQKRMTFDGWVSDLLALQLPNGHWGEKFYQPKWISTHYTILDLRNFECDPDLDQIKSILARILNEEKGPDGGLLPIGSTQQSDVCVNGMAINYLTYFGMPESDMHSIVDFILSEKMSDGGFNCQSNRKGARHSSLHSTISVMEGFENYLKLGYSYKAKNIKEALESSTEFILMHRLYKSDKTGNVISQAMTKRVFPWRWKFNILRCLWHFAINDYKLDPRCEDAINVLIDKKGKDNRWKLQAHHPGKRHFDFEKVSVSSRIVTMMAMKVLNWYGIRLEQ